MGPQETYFRELLYNGLFHDGYYRTLDREHAMAAWEQARRLDKEDEIHEADYARPENQFDKNERALHGDYPAVCSLRFTVCRRTSCA